MPLVDWQTTIVNGMKWVDQWVKHIESSNYRWIFDTFGIFWVFWPRWVQGGSHNTHTLAEKRDCSMTIWNYVKSEAELCETRHVSCTFAGCCEDVSEFWKRERLRRRGLIEEAGWSLSLCTRDDRSLEEEEMDWTQYALSVWTQPFLLGLSDWKLWVLGTGWQSPSTCHTCNTYATRRQSCNAVQMWGRTWWTPLCSWWKLYGAERTASWPNIRRGTELLGTTSRVAFSMSVTLCDNSEQ